MKKRVASWIIVSSVGFLALGATLAIMAWNQTPWFIAQQIKPAESTAIVSGYLQVIRTADGGTYRRVMNSMYDRFWENALEPDWGLIDPQNFDGKYCQLYGYIDEASSPMRIRLTAVKIIGDDYFIIGKVTKNDKTKDPPMGGNVEWLIADEMGAQHYIVFKDNELSKSLVDGNRYKAHGNFTPWGHKSLGVAFKCTSIQDCR